MRVHALVPALLALAAAQSAQEPAVACRNCGNHGSIPCPKHGRGLLELEKSVEFCSEAAACRTCKGALEIDCRSCRNGPAERRIDSRISDVAAWLDARRRQVDRITDNVPLMHLRTAHVDLCFSIRPLTVGKVKMGTHELMHLFGQRIEDLRGLFLRTLALEERDLPARLGIYMFRDQQDHTRIGPRVTGMGGGGTTGTKLMGVDAVYSMWHDQRSMPDEEALHRTIVHNVVHLLASNMLPSCWIGNRRVGWLDAGLAHWFEDKVTGKCANFCYEEVALEPGAGFKGGRWRVPVRKLLEAGKLTSFAELSAKNTDQLDFEEHATSFALVDFLLATRGGAKLRDLLRAVKGSEGIRGALEKVYGLNPITLDEAFRAWVREEYPLVERR
ncbi:MAG: hypothetical protein Fur0037_18980 [Planctomycetota bacterium]